ncbi:unnamed protein product, partial [Rotaria sp. Silwood2]
MNETFNGIDLMDEIGFKDEAFIINLLDTLKGHKSIKYLSLHVQDIRPSNQKEIHLVTSLRNDKLISHLCISASVISRELTKALIHASKERNTLTHLEFYNSQVADDDMAQLKSLYNNGTLIKLAFYEQPRWPVTLEETNGQLKN